MSGPALSTMAPCSRPSTPRSAPPVFLRPALTDAARGAFPSSGLGRRNAAQPDKETFRSPLRRERRSIERVFGQDDTPYPKRRPCRDDGLGQTAFPLGGAWRKPGNPAI